MTPEEIIRGGKLPTRSVPICMRADLAAEHERLDRELERASAKALDSLESGGGEVAAISQKILALQAEMTEHTVDFVLQGLPRRQYNDLKAEHPPKDERMIFDPETFGPALIRACTTKPELSDEVWTLLLDEKLTDFQYDQLSNAAYELNREAVSVPLSRRASRVIENAGPGSKPRNGSESPSVASTAGNPSRSRRTSTTKRAGSSGR